MFLTHLHILMKQNLINRQIIFCSILYCTVVIVHPKLTRWFHWTCRINTTFDSSDSIVIVATL